MEVLCGGVIRNVMRKGKAVRQSDLTVRNGKAKGEAGIDMTKDVVNQIILGVIPEEKELLRKGNFLSRGNSGRMKAWS